MTIEAKVIADSISREGKRLTTMQLRYPRFIHAEVMTHRVFSRNASSSRATPVSKLIMEARQNPAIPIHWGKNQPGMQAHEQLNPAVREMAKRTWLIARDQAVEAATAMVEIGAHKQLVNRILEPFTHISVVVTATEWANFFGLRIHEDAEPHIRALATSMREAMKNSNPFFLEPGEWHLPYYGSGYWTGVLSSAHFLETAIKLSVARCARVSYLTHDGERPDIEDDLKLYDRLVGSTPLHASPAEHQATPDTMNNPGYSIENRGWTTPHRHGNFVGWIQYRKTLPNECILEGDY